MPFEYAVNYRKKRKKCRLQNVTKGLLDYDREASDSIMQTIDKINNRYGGETIKIASEGIKKIWRMKRENVSPCYTTRFDELVEVKS